MPGTGDEPDARTLEVVVWIAECMDLQLAAVAGSRIHMADPQGTLEYGLQFALDLRGLGFGSQRRWQWFAQSADTANV